MSKALSLMISGRVHGVGYRDAMTREARRLGVVGWVRNRTDGTVEAYTAGEEAALQALVQWAQRGPPAARVTGVDVSPAALDPTLLSFQQRPTI